MVPNEFLLCVHHDLQLLFTIVAQRVRFLVGKKVKKFQFHAEVVEPLMHDFGELKTERLVVARNVAHRVGLLEDVLISEQRFIRRGI